MIERSAGVWIGAAVALGLSGCIEHRVKTEPIEVEPIHVTVDINYRVDRRLEEFFEFQKKQQDGEPQSTTPQGPTPPDPTLPDPEPPGPAPPVPEDPVEEDAETGSGAR